MEGIYCFVTVEGACMKILFHLKVEAVKGSRLIDRNRYFYRGLGCANDWNSNLEGHNLHWHFIM